jgi:hypothetical protein
LTYARRYSLAAFAGVATGEDDDAEKAHEPKRGGSAANTTPPARQAPVAPAPRQEPPAAEPQGFHEIWSEQEFTDQTIMVVGSICAVHEPRQSQTTGKFGPFKIDIQPDGGDMFTVDTFDKKLAESCRAAGDSLREIAFDEMVNGRFTNRKLMGIR